MTEEKPEGEFSFVHDVYPGYPRKSVEQMIKEQKTEEGLAYSSEHIDGFDSSQDYKVGKVMRVTAGKPPTDYVAYNDKSQIRGIILHEGKEDISDD